MIPVVARILRGQLARNALALYAVQGLNFLLPLVVLPFLLRRLGPEGYGAIVLAQAFLGYFIMLTDFGFNLTAARDISVARDDAARVARIYWTTQAARGLLLLLSAVLIVILVAALPAFRKEWTVFAVCSVMLVGSVLFPAWYFQGLERLRETAMAQAMSKCLLAACIFAFIRSPQQTLLAAFFMSSPQLAGLIAAVALGYRAAPRMFYRPGYADIRGALAGSLDMFLSTISSSLYLYTNTVILGLMAGERAVGCYGIANRLIIALQSLAGPVTQAVFPRASMLFASEPDRGWELVRRVSWLLFPALGLATVVMIVFAPWVVQLIAGGAYAQAIPVMRIMAPVPLLVTLASLLAQTIMVNLRLTRFLWRIYIVVGLFNLALLPFLVHFFAASGAAASLTLAEALGPLFMFWVLRREYSLPRRRGMIASDR